MKFSYNWLREMVEGLDTPARDLERRITIKIAECEGIEEIAAPQPALAPDTVIEVDNKSLTHRPDLWGHHGIAREAAAITGKTLRDPARLELLPSGAAAIAVKIADLSLCPRYSALVFDNVTVKPSPLW